MKKIIAIMFMFFLAFSITACSKKPSDTLSSVKPCWDKDDKECAKAYYTKESVKKLEDEEKKSPGLKVNKKGKGFGLLEWEVISEDIQGDSAQVKIKFVEHPKEKLIGHETTYYMKKEDAEWKIDVIATLQKKAMERENAKKTMKAAGESENPKKSDKLNKK